MDFKNAQELLELCEKHNCAISEIMKKREIVLGEISHDELYHRMAHSLAVMRESATTPIHSPRRSIGGLIGGEAQLVTLHHSSGKSICGSTLSKAIAYSMAVLETNTSMGLIVAAPTAGSSGVIPGVRSRTDGRDSFAMPQRNLLCSHEPARARLRSRQRTGRMPLPGKKCSGCRHRSYLR